MSFAHPKEERSIIPLFLTVFIDMLGVGIVIPILAVVLLDPSIPLLAPGTSDTARNITYGILLATFPLAQFLSTPILGALSDRHGRKPLLFLSLVGTALSYAVFGLGLVWGNVAMLFLGRIAAGIAGGNVSIALSSIADFSEGKQKTKNFGLMAMAFGLGFILGPYIGGKLADPNVVPWFDVSTPFFFAGALTMLNVVLCAWVFSETNHHRSTTPISAFTGLHNLQKAFTLPRLRAIFASIFLLTIGFNFFTQFFQVFLIDRFEFTTGDIGDFFAYAGVWIAIVQGLLVRPISHWLSNITIYKLSTLGMAVFVPMMLLPDSWGIYVLVPFLALFYGLSQVSSTTLISDWAGKESQGEIMGINQSIQSLGMTIPPLVAGVVINLHVTAPIWVAGSFCLISWIAFARYKNPPHVAEVFHEIP